MLYGGPTHVALRYGAMKRFTTFTISDLTTVFPHKFNKPSRASDCLNILKRQGFVYEKKGAWKITNLGVTFLNTNIEPYRGEFK